MEDDIELLGLNEGDLVMQKARENYSLAHPHPDGPSGPGLVSCGSVPNMGDPYEQWLAWEEQQPDAAWSYDGVPGRGPSPKLSSFGGNRMVCVEWPNGGQGWYKIKELKLIKRAYRN